MHSLGTAEKWMIKKIYERFDWRFQNKCVKSCSINKRNHFYGFGWCFQRNSRTNHVGTQFNVVSYYCYFKTPATTVTVCNRILSLRDNEWRTSRPQQYRNALPLARWEGACGERWVTRRATVRWCSNARTEWSATERRLFDGETTGVRASNSLFCLPAAWCDKQQHTHTPTLNQIKKNRQDFNSRWWKATRRTVQDRWIVCKSSGEIHSHANILLCKKIITNCMSFVHGRRWTCTEWSGRGGGETDRRDDASSHKVHRIVASRIRWNRSANR